MMQEAMLQDDEVESDDGDTDDSDVSNDESDFEDSLLQDGEEAQEAAPEDSSCRRGSCEENEDDYDAALIQLLGADSFSSHAQLKHKVKTALDEIELIQKEYETSLEADRMGVAKDKGEHQNAFEEDEEAEVFRE